MQRMGEELGPFDSFPVDPAAPALDPFGEDEHALLAALEAFAALAVLLELRAQRVQALHHLVERGVKGAVGLDHAHGEPAVLFAEYEAQIARRLLDRASALRKI